MLEFIASKLCVRQIQSMIAEHFMANTLIILKNRIAARKLWQDKKFKKRLKTLKYALILKGIENSITFNGTKSDIFSTTTIQNEKYLKKQLVVNNYLKSN